MNAPIMNSVGSQDPPPIWCGRLDLHLVDRAQRTVALLEFSLRVDVCTVWYLHRTLAIMQRDTFRAWLLAPMDVLVADDLTWSLEGARMALSIDREPPYLVPDVFITQLVTVI